MSAEILMEQPAMDLRRVVAVVTGADRGLGRALAAELVARGARKVYATARESADVTLAGVQALRLDVTDPDAIAAVAATARDATLVVNSAGVRPPVNLLDGDLRDIDLEMETTFYGRLGMLRAFAPILAANGGGTILDVLAADGAAAAAAAELARVAREALAPRGIRLTALRIEGGVADPRAVAIAALDAVQATGRFRTAARS
jgi:NAD(P)-dependent dehydrogenase (short-subunit alcohol dehydrogenase family)